MAEVPTPAVIHWKVGHFGALVDHRDGRYLLRDSVYPQDRWIDAETVAEEGSGYFLLPLQGATPSRAGFAAAEAEQKTRITGRGYVNGPAPQQSHHQEIQVWTGHGHLRRLCGHCRTED
ncbi:hypothetical protein HAP94_18625 [Acidithiobacillus ferrivorans]|nr:hypothetical protein [Acidithiobacillus ferrivorans]